MTCPKAYDMLGLAQRAGQVHSGEAAAEALIKKGKAVLVIIAEDASERTKRHFRNMADFKRVRCIEGGNKLRLGTALGKSPRSVVVVTDEGFAGRLCSLLLDGDEENF